MVPSIKTRRRHEEIAFFHALARAAPPPDWTEEEDLAFREYWRQRIKEAAE